MVDAEYILSEWEFHLDKQILKKTRSHFGSGLAPHVVGNLVGLTEKEVLRVWYPTNTILEPFTKLIARRKLISKSKKAEELPPDDILIAVREYLLSGLSDTEVAAMLDIPVSRIQKYRGLISTTASERRFFAERCNQAKLHKALEVYDYLLQSGSVDATLEKFNINERKLGMMRVLAQKHLKKEALDD